MGIQRIAFVLFILLWVNISLARVTTLPAGTEVYIVESTPIEGSSDFNVLGLQLYFDPNKPDEPPKRFPIRMRYNPEAPHSKIFSNNADDLYLVRHTIDIEKASYLKTHRPLRVNRVPTEEFRGYINRNPDWENHFYKGRRAHMTLFNDHVGLKADDLLKACPRVPQNKEGNPCPQTPASQLHPDIINDIRQAANEEGLPPELLATVVHLESTFDPFSQEQQEKADCLTKGLDKDCPSNGWGKGLSQLGRANSHLYGLNWSEAAPVSLVCRGNPQSATCYRSMNQQAECLRPKAGTLPWNCPKASIQAAAKKIAALYPKEHFVWVRDKDHPEKLIKVEIMEKIKALGPEEQLRARLAIYARGPRYLNSWADFYEQTGRWPRNYGEVWSVPRTASSPSKVMGYQMLTNEFTNRCYVFRAAGICNGLPENSLANQYQKLFGTGSSAENAESFTGV